MSLAISYPSATGRRDLVAGLTVAAVALPQGIAYALIAGVDPKYGVYSAIVVTAIASVFGSSAHLINGPTSAISLLVFSSLAFIDPENRTVLFESLFVLSILVGTFQILIAVFKLGDLTRYISESVIIGFMAAASLILALGQIGNALGVKNKGDAHTPILKSVYLTVFHGDAINLKAVFLSVSAVVVAVALRKLVKRYGLPQIDLLTVLIVAGVIAFVAGWSTTGADGKTAVNLAAKVPQSLPTPQIPTLDLASLAQLSQGALAIAFIGASSRPCRSRRPSRTRRSRRSTTTGRSSPRGWPTWAAASSRACPVRVRCLARRSTSRPGRPPGSPASSPPSRWPSRCCCSPHCCTTFRRRRWPACCW